MPLFNIKEAISPAKHMWQYVLAIFIMSSVFIPFVWDGPYDSFKFTAMALVWSFAIWFTQIFGHTLVFQLLDKKFSWQEQPLLRGIVGVFSIIIYASVAFIGVQILMELIYFQSLPGESLWELIVDSKLAIIIASIFSVMATLVGFLKAWRKSELEKEKVKTEMMVYKYNALQNQINPHFLFNSFNVLSELVYEDQELATTFIRQMSDLYRYVLATRNEDLVPLHDEIDFINAFIFLLQTRFEKRVNIQHQLLAHDGEQIVPMALQVLVENAVKHNEATSAKPLHIVLERNDDTLTVRNNLQLKARVEDSTKTGLAYLKERYAYLGKEVSINQTGTTFEVDLPILKLENG
jgi:two-component system LytT family sensor kinase